jgi:type IV pilus assembly protein PilB
MIEYMVDYTDIISTEQAWHYKIVPQKKQDNKLYVYGLSDALLNEIEFLLDCNVEITPLGESEIERLLNKYYDKSENPHDLLKVLSDNENNLFSLINEAKSAKASDIHIETYDSVARVRFRIDGQLIEKYTLNKSIYPSLVNKIKIQANLDISEKRLPQDGRVFFENNGNKFDIRVSVLPVLYGEKIVMRLLSKDASFLDVNDLGFQYSELKAYLQAVKKPHGIILISGPTGSWKTTTLYATLKVLNDSSKNIITIEDPIEYTLDGINQAQVKENIGFGFAHALRTFLRQDPDIIMLGEIRDSETAKMAIRASLTGHLVLSTIHTNSALGTISRLIDMDIPAYLIADTLNLSMAQRLLRLLCQSCKQEQAFKIDEHSEQFKSFLQDVSTHFVPIGCSVCNNTGYQGRKAIYEILNIDKGISELIHNKELSSIPVMNNSSLQINAVNLFRNGLTSFNEIVPVLLSSV